MNIYIIQEKISQEKLIQIAKENYGTMTKGVVDLGRQIMALGGELHADAEEMLLGDGSKQKDLWGFNIHVDKSFEERLEYTSFINIRPSDGNTSLVVKDDTLKSRMKELIDRLVDG